MKQRNRPGKSKKKHECEEVEVEEEQEEEGEPGQAEGKQTLKRLRHMTSSKIAQEDSPENETTQASCWKQEKLTNMKTVRFYKPFPFDARPTIRKRVVKLRQVTLDSMPTVRFRKWPGEAKQKGKGKGGKGGKAKGKGASPQAANQTNNITVLKY